jgi:spermidine/putrescine transport system ATP-binding protein/putrescine transport system ATP-binding protein
MVDEAYIDISGVSKRFADVVAVDHAEIQIRQGEFFSLLGPSGCGKTTLLRMIAGFENPSEGEIYIDTAPMSDVPPNRRPTNMVFQSYAIFPHLNVFDNIAYGLRKERLARNELSRRVKEALAMVRLEGLEKRGAGMLSGGQRQRVALARALIKRPKVLLLDEPLGALDKRLREAMQIELRQLQKNVGITFVFVTHDQEEALSMSDRIAVMSGGKVLQVAGPRELYEHPNCREVADFIGTMNFFDAVVKAADDHTLTIDAGPVGVLRAAADGAPVEAKSGAKLLVALRPEKIRLSQSAPATGPSVRGTVGSAAYLGERSHFHVKIEGHAAPVSVAAQNAARNGMGVQEGGTVYLTWDEDAPLLLAR